MSDPASTPRLIVDKASEPEPEQVPWPEEAARIPPQPDDSRENRPRSLRGLAIAARVVLQVVLAAAILFGGVKTMQWLIATKPEGVKRPAREQVYTVQMTEVKLADQRPDFIVYGNTVAGDEVDLRVLVSGEITAVHPDLSAGHVVKAGEVLVEVDRFEYEGALTEAQANLQEALARLAEIQAKISYEQAALERSRGQLALAEKDLQRSNDLLGRGSGTQKSVDDRQLAVLERSQSVEQRRSNLEIEKARAEQQRATIRRLEWKVAQAKRDLENTRLKAPFDAVISSESAGLGRNVSANDVVVSLYHSDSLEVRFVVTDAQYGRLVSEPRGIKGRPVEVIWTIGGAPVVFDGRIERVGAELKSDRGGVELFAAIDLASAPADIRPGAFVEVSVPDMVYSSSVLLPETAVYNGNIVYVIEDGRLASRRVTIETYTGGNVVISSGLAAGETVLTTQIADARDGLKVVGEDAQGGQSGETKRPAAGASGKDTAEPDSRT